MSAIQYHQLSPESTSEQYTPFQTVDYVLNVPGRKLVKNSIRIEGRVVARTNTTATWLPDTAQGECSAINASDNIKIDNMVGAHAYWDSWTCETQSKGVLETLQQYPRFVSQQARATLGPDDMNTAKMVAEQRGPTELNGNIVLQPVVDQAFKTGGAEQPLQRSKPGFSIKPMICFNRSAGGDYSFDRNGFIRISGILASNSQAMFAGDADTNYVLEDLVCRFVTTPDDGNDQPMLMRSYVSVVSSINSTSSTISARVPSSQVSSVSVTFAKQAHLRSPEFNSYALESIPKWDSVEYLFANSLQNFITYSINDEDDALLRGLSALESAGHSSVSADTLRANKGMIMGLDFNSYIDLSKQKFTINLKILDSSVTADPFDAFCMFHSIIEM